MKGKSNSPTSIDSLSLYLREIGREPYLSHQVERMLFERLETGDRAAKVQLVTSHLRMVVPIAKTFRYLGLPFPDLIQEGNLGLHRAVERFDYRTGYRLSTYASPLVYSTIDRAVANTARTIRVPVDAQRKLAKIRRAERFWPTATRQQIAEATGFSTDEIDWLRRNTTPPVSLDAAIADAPSSERAELVPDALALLPDEEFIEAETSTILRTCLLQLSDREREVLERRCGFGDYEVQSLEEIGRLLGRSRERIRQVEEKALETLRCLLDGQLA